ncbi:MAG: DNA-binding protein [Byssovorax sp.]
MDSFVSELSDLVRQATMGEIVAAIQNADRPASRASAPAAIAKAGEKRRVAAGTPARGAKAPSAASRTGYRRAPELLGPLMTRVRAYIKGHPGQAVGSIAVSLGTSTRDLSLVLRKLVGEKTILMKGKKRGTRYFPL